MLPSTPGVGAGRYFDEPPLTVARHVIHLSLDRCPTFAALVTFLRQRMPSCDLAAVSEIQGEKPTGVIYEQRNTVITWVLSQPD